LIRLSVVGLFVCLAAALVAGGCGSDVVNVSKGDRAGVLLLGNQSDPKELDPHIVTGVPEFNVIAALIEGLVAEDPKDLSPAPGVAERWEVSPDGVTYTFHLRENARWSNGDPVTAGDFVFSFQRMLSPKLASPYAYMLFCLRKGEPYHKGEIADFGQVGARAQDTRTLVLTLDAPVPYFLSLLNHHSWFPVHPPTILKHGTMDALGTAWTRAGNFVGNGPFVLKAWQPNRAIVVEKNATYWDAARVKLNEIRFLPIGDHKTEERAFLAGQLHVTGTVPIDRIAHYRETQPDRLRLDPYLGVYYLLLNVKRPPLDRPAVRRALAMAVDREQLVRYVTKGGESPAGHFTPPDTSGYTARARIPDDLEQARRLLAEAGFPEGKGFPRVTLLYNTSESHARIAQAVQQMWKTRLGVEIELLNMEWKFYLDKTQSMDYDIARAGWIGDYADPNTFLDLWLTGGGNNRTGWSNTEYDALVKRAGREADPATRMETLQQAERILLDEAPIVPLYFYRRKCLIQPSVRGWHPNVLDHHPYKHVYLEPAGAASAAPER
jgi:oligopeptide transport system substrate-binding protein